MPKKAFVQKFTGDGTDVVVIHVMVKEGMGAVPKSGQWRNYRDWDAAMALEELDSEYTCTEGEHFPPAMHGSVWCLVDATKHKADDDG